ITAVAAYPVVVKIPVFIGAAALVVAVFAVNMRPSVEFLNASRPPRPTATAGTPAPGLRGLFAPRGIAGTRTPPPPPARSAPPAKADAAPPAQASTAPPSA